MGEQTDLDSNTKTLSPLSERRVLKQTFSGRQILKLENMKLWQCHVAGGCNFPATWRLRYFRMPASLRIAVCFTAIASIAALGCSCAVTQAFQCV